MPGIFKSTCFKRKILWTIHLLCWLQNLNMRMEEQRFESMYLLLRMVICQLVKQTLRKNHPESLTDSDRWVVLPFDIKICLFFIQTQKNFQSNVYIYIYLHTVHHICIREYICVYIYILYIKSTSNPHLPKHPLTTLRWLFFGDRAPFLWYLHTIRIQEPPDLSHLRPQAWLGRGGWKFTWVIYFLLAIYRYRKW